MGGNWKKSATVMLGLVLSVSLAACGGNNATSSNAPAGNSSKDAGSEAKPVKLRVNWWGGDERHQATQKAMELYTKLHPNVTFEVDFADYGGYWDKMATLSAADNLPDIMQMDSNLGTYYQHGQLAELTGIETSNIDEALLNVGKIDGKLYGLPLGGNAVGLVYNKAALEKLNVEPPQDNWTWDDFVAYGKNLQQKLGKDKYAMVDMAMDRNTYDAYQLSRGKDRTVDKNGVFQLDKETFLAWTAMWDGLRQEGVVPPASVSYTDAYLDATRDLMVNGTTLFRDLTFAAQFSSYNSLMPDSIGAVQMPRGQQSGGWLQYSVFWAVSAKSKNVEEARKFIDWFVNDLDAADILTTSRGIPVSKAVTEHLDPMFTPIDKMAIAFIEAVAKDAQPFDVVTGWGNWEKDFATIMEKQVFGKQAAEDTYNELVKLGKQYEENNKK